MASSDFIDLQKLVVKDKTTNSSSSYFDNHSFQRIISMVLNEEISQTKYTFLNYLNQILEQEKEYQPNPSIRFFKKDVEFISEECWDYFSLQSIISSNDVVVKLKSPNTYVSRQLIKINEKILSQNKISEIDRRAWLDNYLVKRDFSVPLDEFLEEKIIRTKMPFKNYFSSAQRKALSAVLNMRSGSTLIVNLPTGGGKSLLFQAPLLLDENLGLILVVVPTTSLALDQERRIKALGLNSINETHKLAFHSGLSEEFRSEIKSGIREGTQRILFVSPEAVVGSLRPALFDAASRGLLSYLFVDEAHLISGWGDTFRSDFQELTAVRRGLLDSSKNSLKTILLSATFTSVDIDMIDSLFGPRENVNFFSAVFMRPEPKYFYYEVENNDAKIEICTKMVALVQKPLIIYTSSIKETNRLKSILKDRYPKVASFTGNTGSDERAKIIADWSGGNLDIIVATSAFGVGIDKGNVRTVMHATVPETVERFYQEVGRGGRDGKTSTSITVFCKEDEKASTKLAIGKRGDNIGEDLGYSRWKKMFLSAVDEEDKKKRINTFNVTQRGSISKTEKGEFHNRNVLFTLARGGYIDIYCDTYDVTEFLNLETDKNLDISKLQKMELDELYKYALEFFELERENLTGNCDEVINEIKKANFWRNYYREVIICIKDPLIVKQDYYLEKYKKERKILPDAREVSNKRMIEIVNGNETIESALSKTYKCSKVSRNINMLPISRGCLKNPKGTGFFQKKPVFTEPIINDYSVSELSANNFFSNYPNRFKRSNIIFLIEDGTENETVNKIVKVLEIMVLNYDIKQINVGHNFPELKKVKRLHTLRNKKLDTLYINILDLENLRGSERFFMPLPSVSVVYPSYKNSLPDVLNKEPVSIFPFHILLVPENTKCKIQNRELKYLGRGMYDEPFYIDDFIQGETR